MTRQRFPLDERSASRIEIAWESLDDVRVFFDDKLLGRFSREAPAEVVATLPDKSRLEVRFRRLVGMEVLRDGVPVPESATHPQVIADRVGKILTILGLIRFGGAFAWMCYFRFTGETADMSEFVTSAAAGLAVVGVARFGIARRSRGILLMGVILWTLVQGVMLSRSFSIGASAFTVVVLGLLVPPLLMRPAVQRAPG